MNPSHIYAYKNSYAAQWALENGHFLYIINDDGSITPPSPFIIDENGVLTGYIGADEEITIPDGVTAIGNNVFNNNNTINNIILPDGVTSIGSSAFRNCENLESITIPATVTSITNYAFYNSYPAIYAYGNTYASQWAKDNGYTLYLLDGPFEIDDNSTLIGYYGIDEEITVPNDVIMIGDYVFNGNSSVKKIVLPDSVTSIGYGAFSNCENLENIEIPSSVTSIEYDAIDTNTIITAYCNSYAAQWAIDNNRTLNYADTCNEPPDSNPFIIDDNGVLIGYTGSDTDVVIPDNVVRIGFSAFENNNNLISVTIPGSVEKIDFYAFKGCENLTNVTIQNGVKEIEYQSFMDCKKLSNISIPNSVTWIHGYVFSGCESLESIILPESINLIDYNTFENCTNLKSIAIPNGVEKIYSNAFHGCISLSSVIIPETVTWMDDYVFTGCLSLQNITIPKSVFSIGYDAIDMNTIITAYCNSYAAKWAIDNNRTLSYADTCEPETPTPEPETPTPEPETPTPEPDEPSSGTLISDFRIEENGKTLTIGDVVHFSAKFAQADWIRNAMVILNGQNFNVGCTIRYNYSTQRWEGTTVVAEQWKDGQYTVRNIYIYDYSGNRSTYSLNSGQFIIVEGVQSQDPVLTRNELVVEIQNLNRDGTKGIPEDMEDTAIKWTIVLRDGEDHVYTSEELSLPIMILKMDPKTQGTAYFKEDLPLTDLSKLKVELKGLPDFVYGYAPVEHKYLLTGSGWINSKGNITINLIWADEIYFAPKEEEPIPVGLPEDEIGAYTEGPNGERYYLIYQTYDICMAYLGSEELCSGNQRCYHK